MSTRSDALEAKQKRAIIALQAAAELRKRAEEAVADAAVVSYAAVAGALRAGLGPTLVAREVRLSNTYVRGVRVAEKIPVNPSYAHLQPPTSHVVRHDGPVTELEDGTFTRGPAA